MRRFTFIYVNLIAAIVVILGFNVAQQPAAAQQLPTYFIANQVIVTGPSAGVDTVLRSVNSNGERLQRISRFDLSYTAALPANQRIPFDLEDRKTLVADLYTITTGGSPGAFIRELNVAANNANVNVRSDPNYVTGRPPQLQGSNPWSIGGSPVAQGGAVPAPNLFHEQWALGQPGIGLYGSDAQQRGVGFDGRRIRVAVFDTQPFSSSVIVPADTILLEKREIDWISPTLTLQVGFMQAAAQLPPPVGDPTVSDHGLFTAGLVHVVAPGSSIELIGVLDKYGRGDLYTLLRAMHDFTRRNLNEAAQYDGAVINLSLGMHVPDDPVAYGLQPTDIVRVIALETAVDAALGFGISVVAASGNDSQSDTVVAADLPAAYADVIGVSGSSNGRGRSCFANRGDLAAPGGDGDKNCAPALVTCAGDCRTALIGPVIPNGAGATGYAYWMGTSFAAPLASGAAALLLDQADGALSPNALATRLADSALPANLAVGDTSLGAGIINVRRALYPFDVHVPLLDKP